MNAGARGVIRRLVLLILAVLACCAAPALGTGPVAGGWAESPARAHGWFVAPVYDLRVDPTEVGAGPGEPVRWVLVHLPPRRVGAAPGVDPGAVRVVMSLSGRPAALAAHGNRVYILSRSADAGGDEQAGWRVSEVSAWAGPSSRLWMYEPAGRARTLPSPGAGVLSGFAADARGPWIMLRPEADATDEAPLVTLRRLARGVWQDLTPPAALTDPAQATLVPSPTGVVVGESDGVGGFIVYQPEPEPESQPESTEPVITSDAGPPTPERSRSLLEPGGRSLLDGGGGLLDGASSGASNGVSLDTSAPISLQWSATRLNASGVIDRRGSAWWNGRALSWLDVSDDAIRVLRASADTETPRDVARLEGATSDAAAVAVPGATRLIVAWPDRLGSGDWDAMTEQERARAASPRGYAIAELSLDTGATLFEGVASSGAPISASEFRALAILLVGVMGLVLIFALRRDPSDPTVFLPPGFALAEPGRRAAATLFDLLLAMAAAAGVLGVAPSSLLSPEAWLTGTHTVWSLPLMLAMGFAMGTAGEALWGWSLGKLLFGCRVVCAAPRSVASLTEAAAAAARASRSTEPAIERWTRTPLGGIGFRKAAARNAFKWIIPPGATLAFVAPDFRHRGDVAAGVVVVRPLPPEPGGERSD
ncbi:MAG: RDD family protein [Planctomycetota bacterium]